MNIVSTVKKNSEDPLGDWHVSFSWCMTLKKENAKANSPWKRAECGNVRPTSRRISSSYLASYIFILHAEKDIETICTRLQSSNCSSSTGFHKNALVVNTGRALEFLSKGKFKATNHRVLWNKTERVSIPFFFEPSYDFKMNTSFLHKSKLIIAV